MELLKSYLDHYQAKNEQKFDYSLTLECLLQGLFLAFVGIFNPGYAGLLCGSNSLLMGMGVGWWKEKLK